MTKKTIFIDHDARCSYRQLSETLKKQIMGGEYLPGAHLPSVDELCRQTGLHANTVKLAFKDLRDWGLVKFQPTVGCVVRDDARFRIALILPENYGTLSEVLTGLNQALKDYGRAELFSYKGV